MASTTAPPPFWIVARTRRLCEHVAKQNLEEQGYEVYLPLSVSPEEPEPRPFFAGYEFVNVEPRAGQWRPVKSTRGVVDVLMTGEAPSRVSARAIALLREREEDGLIQLELSKAKAEEREARRLAMLTAEERAAEAAAQFMDSKAGDRLRVEEGSFTGFDAVFDGIDTHHRIWAFISLFGRVSRVSLPAQDVQKVA